MLNLIIKLINIYSYILVIYAISSWIPAIRDGKFGYVLHKICDPYLDLFRGLPLQIGGLDFTVIVALFALQLIQRFLIIIF